MNRAVRNIANSLRLAVLMVSCVALFAWAFTPAQNHIPTVFETLQENAEMIAEHGHSHGFEEDLMWAMHGHSHDVADHDHTQAIFQTERHSIGTAFDRTTWHQLADMHWVPPSYRLDRPPRG